MTENIKCPTCGSEDIGSVTLPRKRPERSRCISCGCEWDEALRQPPNTWIACSERLPEDGTIVLVYCINGLCEEYITILIWNIDKTGEPWNITHWQPRPQPPKERK